MPEALIIDACRTPRGIGKVGKGALAGLPSRSTWPPRC
jgi:acetyl-CoA C-acetyltransferase